MLEEIVDVWANEGRKGNEEKLKRALEDLKDCPIGPYGGWMTSLGIEEMNTHTWSHLEIMEIVSWGYKPFPSRPIVLGQISPEEYWVDFDSVRSFIDKYHEDVYDRWKKARDVVVKLCPAPEI